MGGLPGTAALMLFNQVEVFPPHQELQYIEYFSGKGNVFTEMKSLYTSTAVDIEYLSELGGTKTNAFDINSASGLGFLSLID